MMTKIIPPNPGMTTGNNEGTPARKSLSISRVKPDAVGKDTLTSSLLQKMTSSSSDQNYALAKCEEICTRLGSSSMKMMILENMYIPRNGVLAMQSKLHHALINQILLKVATKTRWFSPITTEDTEDDKGYIKYVTAYLTEYRIDPHGEQTKDIHSFKATRVEYNKNTGSWAEHPRVMLKYRAIPMLARTSIPDVMLDIYGSYEFEDEVMTFKK